MLSSANIIYQLIGVLYKSIKVISEVYRHLKNVSHQLLAMTYYGLFYLI